MPSTEEEVEKLLDDGIKKTVQEKEKKAYNPNDTARQLIKEHRLIFYAESFFTYRNGKHHILTENEVRSLIHQCLNNFYRPNRCKELIDCMGANRLCLRLPDEINNHKGLNLSNGILNLDTLNLEPHSPDYNLIYQIQTPYIPTAECPKWLAFLERTLGDDLTKADVLQEYSGYCLDQHQNLETLLFLLGRGANGKSVFANTIQRVLGYDNCENLSLDDLKNKNYLAELLGKLVNIATESQSKAEVYESTLKRLASGEPIKVDRKFKHPFTFVSNCKHIYCLNNLPRVTDKTDAFFRRIVPIPFNHQVRREDQILRYDKELASEAPGILNWMISGLLRLKDNHWRFSESPQVNALLDEYRRDNNNVLSFVDECCEIISGVSVKNQELYEKYSSWCKSSGTSPMKKKSLVREIFENFHPKGVERYHTNQDRGLSGICLVC
jgi:P4 family phage/plasmid primase-like protien